MRRTSLWWSLLLVGIAGTASAETSARASLGLDVEIGSPTPSRIVVREEPRMVLVPNSTVYVIEDSRVGFDFFRYGVYWYAYDDGHWYRARSYRGPFRFVEVKYVPRAIMTVPARHWRAHPHGGPPGQMKKGGGHVVVREKHGNGKGKGGR